MVVMYMYLLSLWGALLFSKLTISQYCVYMYESYMYTCSKYTCIVIHVYAVELRNHGQTGSGPFVFIWSLSFFRSCDRFDP